MTYPSATGMVSDHPVSDERASAKSSSCQESLTSHSITRINDDTSQGSLVDFRASPRSSQSENGLDGDIKTLNVEGFEHDLGRIFSIFRWIERRLSLRMGQYQRLVSTLCI